jgi:hypothetical protein
MARRHLEGPVVASVGEGFVFNVRGGSVFDPVDIYYAPPLVRLGYLGFRLARTLGAAKQ